MDEGAVREGILSDAVVVDESYIAIGEEYVLESRDEQMLMVAHEFSRQSPSVGRFLEH